VKCFIATVITSTNQPKLWKNWIKVIVEKKKEIANTMFQLSEEKINKMISLSQLSLQKDYLLSEVISNNLFISEEEKEKII